MEKYKNQSIIQKDGAKKTIAHPLNKTNEPLVMSPSRSRSRGQRKLKNFQLGFG